MTAGLYGCDVLPAPRRLHIKPRLHTHQKSRRVCGCNGLRISCASRQVGGSLKRVTQPDTIAEVSTLALQAAGQCQVNFVPFVCKLFTSLLSLQLILVDVWQRACGPCGTAAGAAAGSSAPARRT